MEIERMLALVIGYSELSKLFTTICFKLIIQL